MVIVGLDKQSQGTFKRMHPVGIHGVRTCDGRFLERRIYENF